MAAGDGIPIPYLKTKKAPFYSQKKVITTKGYCVKIKFAPYISQYGYHG